MTEPIGSQAKWLITENLFRNHNFGGRRPKEGKDWAHVPGIEIPLILYVVYRNTQGIATLHIEDTSGGNCSDCEITSEEILAKYERVPQGLKEQLRSLM